MRKVFGKLRRYGFWDALQYWASKLARALFHPLLRRRTALSIRDLTMGASSVHTSPSDFLGTWTSPGQDLATFDAEFEILETEAIRRGQSRHFPYRITHQIERGTSRALYALARISHPPVVLETGVANGLSTFFLLNALKRNGTGTLHSVDIAPDVGGFLEEADKARWNLHILDGTKESFVRLLRTLPPIDFFLHDSDHSYWWHRFELRAVLGHMAPCSYIASDDVDGSFAFLDFCGEVGARPRILLDQGKAFGLLRLEPPLVGGGAATESPSHTP